MDQQDIQDERLTKDTLEKYGSERVAHLARLAARGFNRALARRLAVHEISFGQWLFLRILWAGDGITQKQLSIKSDLTEPTVHTSIKKLEAAGIVERKTQGTNKKKMFVFLTKKGWELQQKLEPLAVEANTKGLASLTPSEISSLRKCLALMVQNLDEDELESEKLGIKQPATRQLK